MFKKKQFKDKEKIIQKLKENLENFFNASDTANNELKEKEKFCLEIFPDAVNRLLDEGIDIIVMNKIYDTFDCSHIKESEEFGSSIDGFLQAKGQTIELDYLSEEEKILASESLYNEWKNNLKREKYVPAIYLPLIPAEYMMPLFDKNNRFMTFYDVVKPLEWIDADLAI